MRYIPYLIAKNNDDRYGVVFNPGAPPRLGHIGCGDMTVHSPYDTPESAKARAESIGMAGGFIALDVELIPAAAATLDALDFIIDTIPSRPEALQELASNLRAALPSVTPNDRG